MSKRSKKFLSGLKKKTRIAYIVVVCGLAGVMVRIIQINVVNGKTYSEAAMMQMNYSSKDIPYERGEILDRNGNVLATNEKTYKLILEPANIVGDEDRRAATKAAVTKFFDVTEEEFDKMMENEDSYYEIAQEGLPYAAEKEFEDYCATDEGRDVAGVQFEIEYQRKYPNGSLACHLLGYTVSGNVGQGGIEGYYSSTLNGVDGKTYSYMSDSGQMETVTADAEDGETVVSTIDMNVQKIIEDNISEYMETTGALQVGVIAMDPNNGEILGMASSRTYDPNDPMNTDALRNMTVTVTEEVEVDGADEDADSLISVEKVHTTEAASETASETESGETTEETADETTDEAASETATEEDTAETTEETKNVKTQEVEYDFSKMTDEEFQETIDGFTSDQLYEALNYVWQNYCISDVYEPGSTYKAFTVAGALEDGIVSDSDEFYCGGYLQVVDGEDPIYCSNTGGHGTISLKLAVAYSCNVAMMDIAEKEGAEIFDKYQNIFNIGAKTGIDLDGETSGIKYDADSLNAAELATSSFGQGVTTSMIQMAAGFSSVINGGNYYVPHVVKRLLDSDGNVVEDIEPVLVRKTISSEVSGYLRDYLQAVVEVGTGHYAAIDGYSIGGKTGTAEKLPRGTGNYVLSFAGFTPVEDPEILLYVVVDEPHVEYQDGSGEGAKLFNQIMTELLPYMNIYAADDSTSEDTTTGDTTTGDTTSDTTTEDAVTDAATTDDTTAEDVTTDDTAAEDTTTVDTAAEDVISADTATEDTTGDTSAEAPE